LPLALLLMFTSAALLVPEVAVEDELEFGVDVPRREFTPLNSTQLVSISTYPNGTSTAIQLEVPDGDAITALGLKLEPSIMPLVDAFSWSSQAEFSSAGAVNDNIDYNSTGIRPLPRSIGWDFESSSHGWSLSSSADWKWGYDTSLGQTAGVHAGTKALYTYNGNYPNYLGGPYYATSPNFDCSLCSGSWDLKFWKRLGVERSRYDHAYVQVTNPSGNWVTLYHNSNSGSTNDGSFIQQSYDISSYAAANSNLKVRFGLGSTDGSVVYTGWNIDDVEFKPRGGSIATGANWTSARFGPGVTGTNNLHPGPYGLMSIDAKVPSGSALSWSILDATTSQPIPGFTDREENWVDLGAIDVEAHSSLKLRLTFNQQTGAESAVVYGVHFQGRYKDTFERDPASAGWILSGATWTGDKIAGSGTSIATSPQFILNRPVSRIKHSMSGGGYMAAEVKFDGGIWRSLNQNGITSLGTYAHTIQVRFSGQGGAWDLTALELDLQGGSIPESPVIDVGLDSRYEWNVSDPNLGPWGWQNRLSTGKLSHNFQWTTASTQQVGLWLPRGGVESLSFSLSPGSNGLDAPEIGLATGGVALFSQSLGASLDDCTTYSLTPSQLSDLNFKLPQLPAVFSAAGNVSYAMVHLQVSADYGNAILSGIVARSYPVALMLHDAAAPFVMAANDEIPNAALSGTTRLVPLPFQFLKGGTMKVTVTQLSSSNSLQSTGMAISNVTSTLAPSYQWIEVESSHSVSDGVPKSIQLDVTGLIHSATVEFLLNGSAPIESGDSHLLIWDPNNPARNTFDGNSTVNSTISFQLHAAWDDEEDMAIKTRLVLEDGRRSIPRIQTFGQGALPGLENDIEILSWVMINDQGATIPLTSSYLKSGADVTVEIDLGFVGLDAWLAPRSGDVKAILYKDGVAIKNSTVVDKGVVSIVFLTPLGVGDVDYMLAVESLHGADVTSSIELNRSFKIDSLAPMVISSNIKHHDHLGPALNQQLRFEVYDRPELPASLYLMLWREWLDDADYNGMPNASEFRAFPLVVPQDLSLVQGFYTFSLDDTDGGSGDIVAGYISGSDAAGNAILQAGGPGTDDQLFMYQLLGDAAPLIPGTGGWTGGEKRWLHPGTDYELRIPFNEPNGISDLQAVKIQLAGNSVLDNLEIVWDGAVGQCNSTSENLIIQRCALWPMEGDMTPYTTDLEFRLEFQLAWSLPHEGELRRAPAIEVIDLAGETAWLELPALRWRFSSTLAIDPESIVLEIESGKNSSEGAWVTPGSGVNVSGQFSFLPTGEVPSTNYDVVVMLDGQETLVSAYNGSWKAHLTAPSVAGNYPLNWELRNLPPEATDETDTDSALFWLVVDTAGPEPLEMNAPRQDAEIGIDSLSALEIELLLKELEQLDEETLLLHWKVMRGSSVVGTALIEGSSPLTIVGVSRAGQSIAVKTTLNLATEIPVELFAQQLSFHVWITGTDMAGNKMASQHNFNHDESPFASWTLQRLAAEMRMDNDDIIYSRTGDIDLGRTIMISMTVHNDGEADGLAELVVEVVHLEGGRQLLTPVPLELELGAGEKRTLELDWVPEYSGNQWIEVRLNGVPTAEGGVLKLTDSKEEQSFLRGALADVDMRLIYVFGGLILILTLVVALALRSGGSKEAMWDDTDDNDYDDSGWTVEGDVSDYSLPTPEPPQSADWTQMQQGAVQSQAAPTPGVPQHAPLPPGAQQYTQPGYPAPVDQYGRY
jgi:hypothetical protein